MASKIQSDGKTVTVMTDEGQRIEFTMAELNLTSTSAKIATGLAGGVSALSVDYIVATAKTEAEAYMAQHYRSKHTEDQAAKGKDKGLSDTLRGMFGL